MSITIDVGIPGAHVSIGTGDRTTHADADEHGVVLFASYVPDPKGWGDAVYVWSEKRPDGTCSANLLGKVHDGIFQKYA